MDVTTLLKVNLQTIIRRLQIDYPDLVFTAGSSLCWSPKGNEIFYTIDDEQSGIAGLLHEIGHARLGHTSFASDIELLRKEVDAWQEAVSLANYYKVHINNDHIESCLDTYRDWLFKRSRCPRCEATGVQNSTTEYACLNCNALWHVTNTRLRRPYRLLETKKKED